MGRQHNRAVKRAAGVAVPNYNSKTSPSHIKYQAHRQKPDGIGKPLLRIHRKRTDLKRQLAEELGLPPDTRFVFRHRSTDESDTDAPDEIEISHGTVVVIDKDDLSLVLAVRCTAFSVMDRQLREKFDDAIATTYEHAHARNECTTNGAHKAVDHDEHHVDGWMGHCGWRGGSDRDRSAGVFALNAFTAANADRIIADRERMKRFPLIRDFLAGRFSTLSLAVFKTNIGLAFIAGVPGFDEMEWDTPNGKVFASILVVTCDGFANRPHTDLDHTRYAFGLWSLVDRLTGKPIEARDAKKLGSVKGACFIVKRFGIKVVLGVCDGTYEMLWDTQIPHYTTPSIARDARGRIIEHVDCKVTIYGSSCQIASALVNRIKILEKEKESMTAAQWEVFKANRVKSYEQETTFKTERLKKPKCSV